MPSLFRQSACSPQSLVTFNGKRLNKKWCSIYLIDA